MSGFITPGDLLHLAANESIILATLKWAAANGRRLTKADLERMGAGVDALVAENERLTKELEEVRSSLLFVDGKLGVERKFVAQLLERIKRMETAGNAMAAYDFIPDNLAEKWAAATEAEL